MVCGRSEHRSAICCRGKRQLFDGGRRLFVLSGSLLIVPIVGHAGGLLLGCGGVVHRLPDLLHCDGELRDLVADRVDALGVDKGPQLLQLALGACAQLRVERLAGLAQCPL
jgi:hypothetical protein